MRFLNPSTLAILFTFVLLIDFTFGLSAYHENKFRKYYGIILASIVVPIDIYIIYDLMSIEEKKT